MQQLSLTPVDEPETSPKTARLVSTIIVAVERIPASLSPFERRVLSDRTQHTTDTGSIFYEDCPQVRRILGMRSA